MKGQSHIFEQVLLFGIAVSIFVACFGIFQLYQSYFTTISVNDQLAAISDMIYAHILELSRIEGLEASMVFSIPRELNGESYTISVNDTDITVSADMHRITYITPLRILSSELDGGRYSFEGQTKSGKGEIIIYKKGYKIIIE